MRFTMKILFVHNFYQLAGGEDQVFWAEQALMKENGHDVYAYTVNNDTIQSLSSKFKAAYNLNYSKSSKKLFATHLAKVNPDIVHCHNFFPLLTPSIFDACKEKNIPSVLTLHNYRLICPSACLMHNDKPWEISIKYSPYCTIPFKVYKNSFLGTASLARMISYHKRRKTWSKSIERIITLTQFSKRKFIEAGFSEVNMVVKPNFIQDPDQRDLKRKPYALFIGRLSREKGINFLLDSWKNIDYSLKIIGDGPEKHKISSNLKNIEYLGSLPNDQVKKILGEAQMLIFPSQWYEGFPMVLVEALACGTPVIVSNIGSMQEIIEHGKNGLHYELGDQEDFCNKVNQLIQNKKYCSTLGEAGRQKYLNNYTPELNYHHMVSIYQEAISLKN